MYSILADYRRHHPKILPHQFHKLEVEEGGVGAGTRIRFDMRILGATRTFHQVVSEREPGRVLVESDVNGSSETTFTVDPIRGGVASLLTIATEFKIRGGLFGPIERYLGARLLRGIYREELERIQAYVRAGESAA